MKTKSSGDGDQELQAEGSPPEQPLEGAEKSGALADSEQSISGQEAANLDIASLRLGQNFEESVGVKKALVTVPVRKPARQAFVRVRPGEEWRLQTNIIELKEERETYLVQRPLWGHLAEEISPVSLFIAIDRQGTLFVWPVKLPVARESAWHRSALEAADMAAERWVSVRSNMHLGAYEVFEALGELSEPEWPDATLEQILSIAFKDRVIDTLEHSVLKRLRGES